ncbi:LysR family transcriptional regulator [Neorhizobium tomejilense]|uniref:LysR family transcriptional regulator n=1 Tax=Neorhizobium tomejilense TaxID=2093828 RepID=UPI003ECF163A
MSDLLNLNRLVFFTSVVESGSFTAAAERLGVAKAVISHQVGKLEQELGVTLLARTTRRLHTTEEGRRFYDRCALILREAEAAYGEMSHLTNEPSGTLTLTAPLDYGSTMVAPVIAAYLKQFPQMCVDIVFDDDIIDLVSGQFDLAIRVGWLTDTSNQARRLGTFEQYLVAAPALALTFPQCSTPVDVGLLPWIENAVLRHPLRWMFSRTGYETEIIEARSAIRTDKTPTAYACVLAGAGVSVFPDYMLGDDIATGRLVRLVPEWTLPPGGIHAVFPAARFRPAKVQRFIEMMLAAERKRASGL